MNTHVKICGLRHPDHMHVASQAGADMIGLVFAPSRRQVTCAEARALVRQRPADGPVIVGVFVNESLDVMKMTVRAVGLDCVQLSGDEPAEVAEALGCPYIKTLHVRPDSDVACLVRQAKAYRSATAILLDTAGDGECRHGGSGLPFDWTLARRFVESYDGRVILAGGLTADNVGVVIAQVGPWGVDVSSGVETEQVKDSSKIERFIGVVKSARGAVA